MKPKTKILIADGLAEEGLAILRKIPTIDLIEQNNIDRNGIKALLGELDILIVRSRTQVDRDLIHNSGKLRLIVRAGIGLDNIDVAAATERGIIVMNAPTGNIVTTAEHALALLFAVSRHVPQADASLRGGKWDKKRFQGNELRGKTLGLIGLGNIGKTVAERAHGLQMKVVGYDPYLSAEAAAKYYVRLTPLDELLSVSDYVSVHVPLTDSTRHLLGKDNLAKMKKGAYLINCARGGIVDEAALIDSLDKGHLSGAALDVFETEPLPADHALLKRHDVVLTPHLGASTDEAQVQVGLEVAEQITQFLQEGAVKNAVNVPNIDLAQMELLRPHIRLCEAIGGFAAQVAEHGKTKRLRIHYEGNIGPGKPEVLTLSLLKGFLTPLLSTPVNFVNVRNLLRERGLRVEESFDEQCADYTSLIRLTVEGDEQEIFTCAGTLFGKGEVRLVEIGQFDIDVIPTGFLLFSKNVDQPGVIGNLGSVLGNEGVNIARMHLGRDKAKKFALAVISVDSKISDNTLALVRQIPGMLLAKQVQL